MHELLLYEPLGDVPTPLLDVEAVLIDEGVILEGESGAAYRPGRWIDSATGARAIIDVGVAPLEDDPLHPPTAYDGWRSMQVSIQIPLSGPHWQCVEALCLVERILAKFPDACALDTEDTARDGESSGPRPWNRPRALASWERLHIAQNQGRTQILRMARLASVCLWRYRRERTIGLSIRSDLFWPEALVLWDAADGAVRSACFWDHPDQPLALPPVDLIIIRRATGAGVMTSEALIQRCTPEPLPHAHASLVLPSAALKDLHAQHPLLPVERFKALDDADWTD